MRVEIDQGDCLHFLRSLIAQELQIVVATLWRWRCAAHRRVIILGGFIAAVAAERQHEATSACGRKKTAPPLPGDLELHAVSVEYFEGTMKKTVSPSTLYPTRAAPLEANSEVAYARRHLRGGRGHVAH